MTITAITPRIEARRSTTQTPTSPIRPNEPTELTSLPSSTEARGFAVYVGLDEVTAAQDGISLAHLVAAIRQTVSQLTPTAQTHATLALAPRGAGGRDVDVVRIALHDPAVQTGHEEHKRENGITIDLSRSQVSIDGAEAQLTDKEFLLLNFLIDNEGVTVRRGALIEALWDEHGDPRPSERTIDVHVRRLRAKLGEFKDIIHTVRGIGYRFDHHADVSVWAA